MSAHETVVYFEYEGSSYEIDHLGIGRDFQWGEFAVYDAAENQLVDFTVPSMKSSPVGAHGPIPAVQVLIDYAIEALQQEVAS